MGNSVSKEINITMRLSRHVRYIKEAIIIIMISIIQLQPFQMPLALQTSDSVLKIFIPSISNFPSAIQSGNHATDHSYTREHPRSKYEQNNNYVFKQKTKSRKNVFMPTR